MADIRVGMGVTGVAQFKSAMTQSRQAVKTLDAELKLNEAQYKKSGDAGTYMAQKTELLKKQIAEQEKVVKAAEEALDAMTKNGTDPASKSFQAMRQQLINAKTGLTTMQTQLRNVGDAGDKAADKTDDLNDSLKSIGKGISFNNICTGISGITSAAESAINAVIKLGKAFWEFETGAAEDAANTKTLATNYGLDVDTVLRMQQAEGTTKIGTEELLGMVNKMWTKTTSQQWDDLGIDITGKDKMALFYETIDKLNQIRRIQGQEGERIADQLAQDIFGKSFSDMGTIRENGAGWLKELLASQNVTSEENIEVLNDFNDAVNDVGDSLKTLRDNVAAALAPQMTELANSFKLIVDSINEWVKTENGQKTLQAFADAIKSIFENITKDGAEGLINGVTEALNGLTGALSWIDEHGGIGELLEDIAIGLAAIAAVQFSANLITVLNGLAGLAGIGGAASAAAGGAAVTEMAATLLTISATLIEIAAIVGIATAIYSYISGHSADDESTTEWEDSQRNYGLAKVTDKDGNVMWLPDPKDAGEPGFRGGDYTYDEYWALTHPKAEGTTMYDEPIGPVQQYTESDPLPVTIADTGNTATGFTDFTGFEITADNYAEWINGELADAAEAHQDEIEAMGLYMVTALMRGIKSGTGYGYVGGGDTITSNLYVDNMTMSNDTDLAGLAMSVQRGLMQTRRGFGS